MLTCSVCYRHGYRCMQRTIVYHTVMRIPLPWYIPNDGCLHHCSVLRFVPNVKDRLSVTDRERVAVEENALVLRQNHSVSRINLLDKAVDDADFGTVMNRSQRSEREKENHSHLEAKERRILHQKALQVVVCQRHAQAAHQSAEQLRDVDCQAVVYQHFGSYSENVVF